jgi:hypothetical protein
MTQLGVVIVSYNTVNLLRECLDSAWRDAPVGDTEVYVVDNASNDGSPEMVSAEFPQTILIRNRQNLGYAKANNQAIVRCKSRFILLLNADARLGVGCCESLIARMHFQPDLGICGPALRNADGSRQPSWGRFPSPVLEASFQAFLYKVLPLPYPVGRRVHPLLLPAYAKFRLVDWVSGAAMLIRGEVPMQIGLLPEESFMYSEDVEYCFRARRAGHEVGYEPAGEVVHQAAGARGSYQDWIVNYTHGSIRYFGAHYPPATTARVARLMVVGNALRYRLWRMIAALSPSRREEAESRCRGYRQAIEVASGYFRQELASGPRSHSG